MEEKKGGESAGQRAFLEKAAKRERKGKRVSKVQNHNYWKKPDEKVGGKDLWD